jgi:hypothetical protein
MWADVQFDLAQILSGRLFPTLTSDPGYRVLLRNAGLTSIPDSSSGNVDPVFAQAQDDWKLSIAMKTPLDIRSSTASLPPAIKSQLETAARMCAQLFIMDLNALDALRERRAKAVILESPVTLYRIWDSKMENRTRHWWFSEHLLKLAITESALANQSMQEWLRDRLAVSLNFGACDQLSEMKLFGNAAVPAIEALGLPMPMYSPITRDATGVTRGKADKDYWDKLGAMFQGQKTQYFLPFVPPDRIRDVSWPR